MRPVDQVRDLVERGMHFCIAPWVHLNIGYAGAMRLCCIADYDLPTSTYGSVNDRPLEEIWQGDEIGGFRLRMLEDAADARCTACYKTEASGQPSQRQLMNRQFGRHLEWVAGTDASGRALDARPVSWDIRFSNVCNLKCRTCGHVNSSKWFSDAKALDFPAVRDVPHALVGIRDSAAFLETLYGAMGGVERIVLAGGEPLLMPENHALLRRLDQLKLHDVRLIYMTNLMSVGQHRDLFDLWSRFRNVTVEISLDGIGARCEYLRKGMRWDTVLRNWEAVRRRCPNVRTCVNFTVSAFNVLHLADCHRELVEAHALPLEDFHVNPLIDPVFYAARVLPLELRLDATQRIEAHMQWIAERGRREGRAIDLSPWRSCLGFLNDPDVHREWPDWISMLVVKTNELDRLRGEDCAKVFPELKPLFDLKRDLDRWTPIMAASL